MENNLHVVVLAAGRGRRMRSSRPKVLHPLLFRPMLDYVLDVVAALAPQSVSLIVGPNDEEVRTRCEDRRSLRCFFQNVQSGTGDAVKTVEPFLKLQKGPILILGGDLVLLTPESLKKMLRRHIKEEAACTIGTTTLASPKGYGRVLRRPDGLVCDVREEADCTPGEKMVNEVNAGVYFFSPRDLFPALAQVTDRNVQREYYLTDVVKVLEALGRKIVPYSFGDPAEVMGIKDRHALWRVESVLKERVNMELMHRGVTLLDPGTTWIDPRCRIGDDVRIEAGCVLIDSALEDGVTLENQCRIVNSQVGAGTVVKQGTYIEESLIGPRCVLGPYAHLRPKCRLEAGVKLGNFVEVKKSSLGASSKAAHLSYIGDAEIGRGVNVGCGFITCNYDGGPQKHKTVVEDGAFIGSDCQIVAPVTVGRGSYIAAGSTITNDVPAESLAISRGRQTTKEGYARRYRRGGKAAGAETEGADAVPEAAGPPHGEPLRPVGGVRAPALAEGAREAGRTLP